VIKYMVSTVVFGYLQSEGIDFGMTGQSRVKVRRPAAAGGDRRAIRRRRRCYDRRRRCHRRLGHTQTEKEGFNIRHVSSLMLGHAAVASAVATAIDPAVRSRRRFGGAASKPNAQRS
jgi:hypothetical protein